MNKVIRSLVSVLLVEIGIVAFAFGVKKLDEKLKDLEKEAEKEAKNKFEKDFGKEVEKEVQQPVKKESKEKTLKDVKEEVKEKAKEFSVQPISEDDANKVNAIKAEKPRARKVAKVETPANPVVEEKKKPAAKKTTPKRVAVRKTPAKKTVVKSDVKNDSQAPKDAE